MAVHLSTPAQRSQKMGKDQFNFEMQVHQSISDYQLALFLVVAKRARIFSQTTNDPAQKELIWKEAADQVVQIMSGFLHHMTDMPLDLAYAYNKNHAVDVDLLAKQMQFFMDYEYVSYVPDTKCEWTSRPEDEKEAGIYDKWCSVYGPNIDSFAFDKPYLVADKGWDEGETTKRVAVLGTDSGSFPILAFERMVYENARACQTIQHFQALGQKKPWKEAAIRDSQARFEEVLPHRSDEERDKILKTVMTIQRLRREEKFQKKSDLEAGEDDSTSISSPR